MSAYQPGNMGQPGTERRALGPPGSQVPGLPTTEGGERRARRPAGHALAQGGTRYSPLDLSWSARPDLCLFFPLQPGARTARRVVRLCDPSDDIRTCLTHGAALGRRPRRSRPSIQQPDSQTTGRQSLKQNCGFPVQRPPGGSRPFDFLAGRPVGTCGGPGAGGSCIRPVGQLTILGKYAALARGAEKGGGVIGRGEDQERAEEKSLTRRASLL